jgi:hypothetical protein
MAYFNLRLKVSLLAICFSVGVLAEDAAQSKSKEQQLRTLPEVSDYGHLEQERTSSSQRILTKPEDVLDKEAHTPVVAPKKLRDKDRANSKTSLDFGINYASVALLHDADLDGYYSEFELTFDADTNFTYADVFAELYLSLNGGPWELYHVTQVFEIEGWSDYDDYTVTTLLTEGYPPGDYDLLIDLIDTYDNSVVATLSADQSAALAYLPLEDTSYEDSINYYSSVSLFDANIQLLTDTDNDGFYRTYSLQFDADVEQGQREIFAEIWLRDDTGIWTLESTTENFWLDGLSTLDTYILEVTLESGYNTGYYDFKIDLYDTATGSFLNSSDAFDNKLAYVPLEDATRDVYTNNTTTIVSSTVSVESGGAGSMGFIITLLLVSTIFYRRRLAINTEQRN